MEVEEREKTEERAESKKPLIWHLLSIACIIILLSLHMPDKVIEGRALHYLF